MREGFAAVVIGCLSALLLPGASALVACLVWVHARRYRHLHRAAFASLWRACRAPLGGGSAWARPEAARL